MSLLLQPQLWTQATRVQIKEKKNQIPFSTYLLLLPTYSELKDKHVIVLLPLISLFRRAQGSQRSAEQHLLFLLKMLEKLKVPQHLLNIMNPPKSCWLKWELAVSTNIASEITPGKEIFLNWSFSLCFYTSCTVFSGTSGHPSDTLVGPHCFVADRETQERFGPGHDIWASKPWPSYIYLCYIAKYWL